MEMPLFGKKKRGPSEQIRAALTWAASAPSSANHRGLGSPLLKTKGDEGLPTEEMIHTEVHQENLFKSKGYFKDDKGEI